MVIQIKHKNSGKVILRVNAATLEGLEFSQASLRRADLPGANLSGADLRGADLRQAELGTPGRVLGKDVVRLGLTWLSIMLVFGQVVIPYLIPALLRSQWLQWIVPFLHPIAWFYVVTLFCLIRVIQALGRYCRALWRPVNLQRANLQGADMVGAALNGANLTGARYDASTRWPDGFDPMERGAMRDQAPGGAEQESLPAVKTPYHVLACAILGVVLGTGALAFCIIHRLPTPPDVGALLPADGAIADVMQPVAPPRLVELTEKLQWAIQKQPEWWLAQARRAKPGEPLPYDPRLGLTRAEYKEWLGPAGSFTLKKVGTAQLRVRCEAKRIVFDGGESVPGLKGVELNETTGAVVTPFGTASRWTRFSASPDQKATGPWTGIEWELEEVNEQRGTRTVVTFDLGRMRKTARGLLRYEVKQLTGRSRTDFIILLQYDLPGAR